MTRAETFTDLRRQDFKLDLNGNGLDDRIEPPEIDVTEGKRELRFRLNSHNSTSPILSAGDIDARWEEAESGGEETACASMATPEQNVVEEIGEAMGLTYREEEELNFGEKERGRDRRRWELDPASADDWLDRNRLGCPPRRFHFPYVG